MKHFLLLVLCTGFCSPLLSQSLKGKASFYSDKFHGRETASGEKYDMYALTAAHLSLPFGTQVKVTNLWNGKSVIVRINDRGPFAEGRIIDVSKQAAVDLQMVVAGVVDVEVEVLHEDSVQDADSDTLANAEPISAEVKEEPGTKVRGDGTFKIDVHEVKNLLGYGVQIGSYSNYLAMMRKVEELNNEGFPDIYVNTEVVKGTRYFRIVVGNFEKKEQAELYLLSLKSEGFEGYVVAHQVAR